MKNFTKRTHPEVVNNDIIRNPENFKSSFNAHQVRSLSRSIRKINSTIFLKQVAKQVFNLLLFFIFPHSTPV